MVVVSVGAAGGAGMGTLSGQWRARLNRPRPLRPKRNPRLLFGAPAKKGGGDGAKGGDTRGMAGRD